VEAAHASQRKAGFLTSRQFQVLIGPQKIVPTSLRAFVSFIFRVAAKINNGCHRHSFPKFPDFSLIKTKFPWPKKKQNVRSSRGFFFHSFIKSDNFQQIFLSHWGEISLRSQWPQTFLPAFNRIKSALLNYFNFPWLFPDFDEFFSLTISWPVTTL